MGTLNVVEFVTLDGVMQGFHGPDERGGFQQSGWGEGYQDPEQVRAAEASMPATAAYLFGRRTYDELSQFWPFQPDSNLMAKQLNDTPKYVATHRTDELTWRNARRIDDDVVAAVTRLKHEIDGYVTVLGSGDLVAQLLAADLVDQFQLFVHPLVLGDGHQLFPRNRRPQRFRLDDVGRTATGVVTLRYTTER
jgi:dihydrofolate reductase